MRDAIVDLRFGLNRIQAHGSFGADRDLLDFEFDGQRLAQIDTRFAGKLAASGRLGGTMERPMLTFDAKGEALAFEKRMEAAVLEARGEWQGDADPRVQLKLAGRKITAGVMRFESISAGITGTLASHTINIGATAPGADFAARFEGELRAEHNWAGRVVSLANRGRLPFTLRAPVSLEAGTARTVLGEATADALGGQLALRSLRWENSRLTSEGGFTGVPAAALLALAGPDLSRARTSRCMALGCWRRTNIDHLCRLNIDQGLLLT